MKCISLDLDGTLLNSKQQISNANKQTIRACLDLGYHVLVNTGRSYEEILPLQDLEEFKIPLFLCNGAEVRNANREIVVQYPISSIVVRQVEQFAATQGNKAYCTKSNEAVLRIYIPNITKEQMETYQQYVNEQEGVYMIYYPVGNDMEIISEQASKGNVLHEYVKRNKLSLEHTAAFGDETNDISQFQVAGKKIVMGNAREVIKPYGNYITKTNDEDGVSYGITHLLGWV